MLLRPSGVFTVSESAPVRQLPPQQRPFRHGVRLAVDVGSVRVGVARSDPGGVLATPLTVLPSGPGAKAELVRAELARLAAGQGALEAILAPPTSLSRRETAPPARPPAF